MKRIQNQFEVDRSEKTLPTTGIKQTHVDRDFAGGFFALTTELESYSTALLPNVKNKDQNSLVTIQTVVASEGNEHSNHGSELKQATDIRSLEYNGATELNPHTSVQNSSLLLRLETYLKKPIQRIWLAYIVIFCLSLGYAIAYVVLLEHFGVGNSQFSAREEAMQGLDVINLNTTLTLVGVAVTEELVFRLIPFVLLFRWKRNLTAVLITTLITSAIFGYLHGGWVFIALQGFIGLLYAGLYLKTGGYNNRAVGRAYAVTVLMHFLYNYMLLLFAVSFS